ncbi:hypothetical protein [Devosia sp.]|uniref:hypothetical protein n=1 Tax=Devosia sp. TaxID=1871048 RepID=UPI002734AC9C|nr:hypothetical protein [Devosia sp.]MDP2780350.1 hypothetical protein [Devosia sp.]
MCSLCGILGCDDHWSSAVARDGVYSRNGDRLSRRREAAHREHMVNCILALRRLRLADWRGRAYVLSTATGKVRIFDSLSHLWPEAEALSGGSFDPLDPELLARLQAQS